MDIAERVREIVRDHLGVTSKVTDDAAFLDLGVDSLDGVEIMMRLEEEFKIVIQDDEAERITTVGEMVKVVERYANGAAR